MDGIFLIFIFLLIAFFIAAGILKYKRQKNDSWTGVVEDKKITKYIHKGKDITDYYLYFKKESGTTAKYNVPDNIYNSLQKGDKVIKRNGESYPVIIE